MVFSETSDSFVLDALLCTGIAFEPPVFICTELLLLNRTKMRKKVGYKFFI